MRRRQPESGRGPEHPSGHHGSARDTNRARPLVRLRPDCCPGGQVSRSWIQRIAIRGRELGVGGFPVVSLQEARAKALANRRLARAGGDPARRETPCPGLPTFAEAAERVWTQLQPGWRHSKHRRDWLTSLTRYAFPSLGKQPVSEITSADVLDTLRPIWHTQPDMARRVRQRIRVNGMGHRHAVSR